MSSTIGGAVGDGRLRAATAQDVLMAAPGLGHCFRANGALRASRGAVSGALAAGRDVVVWPGGEQDAMRNLAQARSGGVRGAPRVRAATRSLPGCRFWGRRSGRDEPVGLVPAVCGVG